jgi:hypothetical protein
MDVIRANIFATRDKKFWGAQAPGLLAMALSPSRTFLISFFGEAAK